MKRTKILATLGPATTSKAQIKALSDAGADAFRFNLSHGTREQWQSLARIVREEDPGAPIVVDTRGPELRLQNVDGELPLRAGDEFLLSLKQHDSLPFTTHAFGAKKGMRILIDDGRLEASIKAIQGDTLTLEAHSDGALSSGRKVTAPGATTTFPALTKEDESDLAWWKRHGMDAVALSFARTAKDVAAVRRIVGPDVIIIAKIENGEGVMNAEETLKAADGLMVARGDLGVEASLEQVPLIQKRLVRLANAEAKPVIVATQMLESMTQSPRPTRAEASDVANAVIDGADCVMLSGETAVGRYPSEAVATMARICQQVDPTLRTSLRRDSDERLSIAEAVSNAAFDLAQNLQVDAIVSATTTGSTARMVARFRPASRLIGVAHDAHVARQLRLSWGVEPIVFSASERAIVGAVRAANEQRLLRKKDVVVVTAGVNTRRKGSTNLIEVHEVGDLLAN